MEINGQEVTEILKYSELNLSPEIMKAIETMVETKDSLTTDLGGTASTAECGDALIRLLEKE